MDYRELLNKYMAHVLECEGWDFLENVTDEFNKQEIHILRRISEEVLR